MIMLMLVLVALTTKLVMSSAAFKGSYRISGVKLIVTLLATATASAD